MNQSNYTLRFPRTYREATGMDCRFSKRDPDKWVFIACAILAAFLAGMMLGAA